MGWGRQGRFPIYWPVVRIPPPVGRVCVLACGPHNMTPCAWVAFWSCAFSTNSLAFPSAHLSLTSPWQSPSLWSLSQLSSQPGLSFKPPCCSESPRLFCTAFCCVLSTLLDHKFLRSRSHFFCFSEAFTVLGTAQQLGMVSGERWSLKQTVHFQAPPHPSECPPRCPGFHWPQLLSRAALPLPDDSWDLSYASLLF